MAIGIQSSPTGLCNILRNEYWERGIKHRAIPVLQKQPLPRSQGYVLLQPQQQRPLPRFVVLTTTRFGKPAIQVGKYRFTRNNRSHGPRALWVCSRVSSGCRAAISTFNLVIYRQRTEHNH
ncbi:hypothetical protein MSG28_008198 [Choristoneura fumiferana]|uniref:Uncharacterized protein n=1 Tax=Choristoneura fumiferana TaxID=7141 RepID=A0ACC0JAN4_CHOFU|nr:hypothetical protein MSG28_008198 [Choristoneura fumiferana]